MVRSSLALRWTAALLAAFALASGCSRPDEESPAQATDPASTIEASSSPAPRMVRDITGLSHVPVPVDKKGFDASMARHYPAALRDRGISGSVLVDVSLDERGVVQSAKVARAPSPSSHPTTHATIRETDPVSGAVRERPMETRYDPAFDQAAVNALRETRFKPAVRDGIAVPFSFRMTMTFSPPSSAAPVGGRQ